ncbi:flavodoxin family protein [Celerinatantimonas yamalensis]|uniref:Flavodoxin family protein n=1 Tax=Celerinatantimonas yamalensis TaxID=559956 RepID=A0ABW9G8A3_9GAMM
MSQVSVIFHSGYGHTKKIAEIVAQSAHAKLIEINSEGDISDTDWQTLAESDAIVFGTPTYMGGPSWQFKKFADTSSKVWFNRGWSNKLFAGFSVSGSLNGDKQMTLSYLQTLAAQHGGLWISLDILPANTLAATRDDLNNLGGSAGLLVQAPSDADAEAIPTGDLKTAEAFGKRINELAAKWA